VATPAASATSVHSVTFVRETKSFDVPDGANLRMEAIARGIDLYRGPAKLLNCRGRGKCKTCRVRVAPEGNASPRTAAELPRAPGSILQIIDHRELIGWRLACQTRVRGPISVTTQAAS